MIDTTTITSADSGKQYALFIHKGKAVGCQCGHRVGQPYVPCKHMKHYNREAVSCEICGRLTYRADGICGKCYGY